MHVRRAISDLAVRPGVYLKTSDHTIVHVQSGTNMVNSAFGIIFVVGQLSLLKRAIRYVKYFRAGRSHSLEGRNSIFNTV